MILRPSHALVMILALAPLNLGALGLGDIQLQSALNQPFKADIELIADVDTEADDLRVDLASREDFDKAGIDRPYVLSNLNFTPVKLSTGQLAIEVTSEDPIREPFLNFLLEVNWAKGRLLREYTVLLDPPVTLERGPDSITAPAVSVSPATGDADAPQPVTRTMTAAPVRTAPMSVGGREYGPVKRTDTLWSIAAGMRQQNESIEQVMLALQRYNPNAFIGNNINRLKRGEILRLPENADVTALSRREAKVEFTEQYREWKESKVARIQREPQPSSDDVAAMSATTDVDTASSDRLELVTQPMDESAPQQQGSSVAGGGDMSRMETEILLVREENESVRQENEALRNRISELSSQIDDIKRLITLKNDEMTEMQAAQQIAQEAAESAVTETPAEAETSAESMQETTVESMEQTAAEVESVVDESAMSQSEPTEAATADTDTGTTDGEAESVAASTDTSAPIGTTELTEQPAMDDSTAVAETTPAVAPAPRPEQPTQGVFALIFGEQVMLMVAGAAGLLLILLAWLVFRRRKIIEEEFNDSILLETNQDAPSKATDLDPDLGGLSDGPDDNSFLSDFSPSDIDALQDETGEVDPLSEADVYIAYGRYQQAEELVHQALEKTPDRKELKFKLLEIYFSARNISEFNDLAEQLHDDGLAETDPEAWAGIATKGRDIDPGNTLYGQADVAADAQQADDDDMDFDLSFGGQDGQPSSEVDSQMDNAFADIFSDKDEIGPDSKTNESELLLDSEFVKQISDTDTGADQDLSIDSLEIDMDQPQDELESASDSLDNDLSLDSLALPSLSESDFKQSDEVDSLSEPSVDLAETSEDEDVFSMDNSESLDDLDLESLEKELEMLSTDLDDKQPEQVADAASDEDEILSLDELDNDDEDLELGATDEVATKMDLARAYIDMGDIEGAKNILEEVQAEGDEAQAAEAKELLDSLPG